jgi:hypothetical protein
MANLIEHAAARIIGILEDHGWLEPVPGGGVVVPWNAATYGRSTARERRHERATRLRPAPKPAGRALHPT